jgi:hypothetical protein
MSSQPRYKQQQQQQQQQQQHLQSDRKPVSQKELCDFLIEKLKNFKNVTINTREITNKQGICYGIEVKNYSLGNLGKGVFHSLSMRTVSHTARIINIKLVFNDNEKRNGDMKLNADAIIQIYREIANLTKENGELNKTIESIRIEEFEDERHNKHLSIIAESTKGASLIYTYLRTIDFVRAINDKYGSDDADAEDTELNEVEITDGMTPEEIDAQSKLLEKKLKALEELRAAQQRAASSLSTDSDGKQPSRPATPGKFNIMVGNKVMSRIRTPTPTPTANAAVATPPPN